MKRRRSLRFRRIPAVFLTLILSLSIGFMLYSRPADEEKPDITDRGGQAVRDGRKTYSAGEKVIPVGKIKQVAIIVDDIGHDLAPLRTLIEIDAPLTFSVLPHCVHTAEAVQMLHRKGKEVLLHLPMEPHAYPGKNPGTGVLLAGMSNGEIRQSLDEALSEVPFAAGVNNHMGSRFMEDGGKLSVVFRSLKEKNLFFVDSMTTGRSRGRSLAKEIGLPFRSRDIFIDNSRDAAETRQEIKNILKAKDRGRGLVIIGHPYPGTISALRASLRYFRSEGIEIVPVSQLMEK